MSSYKLMCPRRQAPIDKPPFHQWVLPDGAIWTSFHRTDTGYLLRFPELADFEINAEGTSIICFPTPDVTEETFEHLYLNQVQPLALSMKGKLVFHGSAVEVNNQAIAFVAESGRGKSTLAASFACNGFRLLTDDGLVFESSSNGYIALPSHPSIRLWSDSEKALITPGTKTAPALTFTSKSRFLAGTEIAFCSCPLPVNRVYFLGDGNTDDIVISPLTGAESMIEWVKNSFLLDIEKRSVLVSHFDQVAELANQPINFRLNYPRNFEQLGIVRQAILDHVGEGCSTP